MTTDKMSACPIQARGCRPGAPCKLCQLLEPERAPKRTPKATGGRRRVRSKGAE